MGDLVSDGMTKVSWVTSLTNPAAPAAPELNAGSDWTPRVTPDGLKTDPTTADVDNSSLASKFTTADVGRTAYDCSLTLKRGTLGTSDDQPYGTLLKGAIGFLCVRRGVPYATNYATGDQVEIYPVKAGERQNIAPAPNELNKFMSPLKLTSDAYTNAIVA